MPADTLPNLWAFFGATGTVAWADIWNPLGWACAILALITLVVIGIVWVIDNWDEITAFIAPIWEATTSWVSETANEIWDYFVVTPKAIPIADSRPITGPLPITIPEDIVKPPAGGPWNVYDIHIIKPGIYGDYERGLPDNPTMLMMYPPDIYKYGRTRYATVMRRYEAFPWANKKEGMILKNLQDNIFGAFEWYVARTNVEHAILTEVGLITAYYAIMGKYPPGNTGKY